MICSKCNATIPDDSAVCPVCGAAVEPVAPEAPAAPAPEAPVTEAPASPAPKKDNSANMITAMRVVCGVFAAIMVIRCVLLAVGGLGGSVVNLFSGLGAVEYFGVGIVFVQLLNILTAALNLIVPACMAGCLILTAVRWDPEKKDRLMAGVILGVLIAVVGRVLVCVLSVIGLIMASFVYDFGIGGVAAILGALGIPGALLSIVMCALPAVVVYVLLNAAGVTPFKGETKEQIKENIFGKKEDKEDKPAED